MKEVILLVYENIEYDYYDKRTVYTYYELEYQESLNEECVYNGLSRYFDKVEIEILFGDSVSVLLNGQNRFLTIITALKIGDKYFELNELPKDK